MTTPRHWSQPDPDTFLSSPLGFMAAAKAEGIEMTLAREMVATARGNLSVSGRHREKKDLDFRAVLSGGSGNYLLMANATGYALGEPDSREFWLVFFDREGRPIDIVPGRRLYCAHEEAFSPLVYWEWRVTAVICVWLVANKRGDTEVRDAAARWLYREAALWCLGSAPRIEVDGYAGPGYAGCGLRCERWNGRVGIRSINPLMSHLLGFEAQEPWGPNIETHKMAREVGEKLSGLIRLLPWDKAGLRSIRDDIGDTRLACNIEIRWYQRGEELLVLSCVIGDVAGRNTGALWLGAVEAGKPATLHEVYPYSSDRVRKGNEPNPELDGWWASLQGNSYWVAKPGRKTAYWVVPEGYALMLRVEFGQDHAPRYSGHWADAFLGGQPEPPQPKPVPVPTPKPPAGDRERMARQIESIADELDDHAVDLRAQARAIREGR